MAFALWSYPNEKTFTLAVNDPVVLDTMEHVRSPIFVLKPYVSDEPYVVIPARKAIKLKQTADWLSENLPPAEKPLNAHLPAYTQLVSDAVKVLKRSPGLEKVVLSRYEDVSAQDFDYTILDQLKAAYPTAFVCLYSSHLTGTWLLASPELFLSRKHNTITAHSLAGTYIAEKQTLGPKERHEQSIVTRYIEEAFAQSGLVPKVEERTVVGSGTIKHLQNRVLAKANPQFELQKLLNNLHPTPAVGGYTKSQALRYIAANEGYKRGMYAGYLGLFQHQEAFSFYVNLRCVQWHGNGWRFFAGAGITKDSDPEKELVETDAKMQVLRSIIMPE